LHILDAELIDGLGDRLIKLRSTGPIIVVSKELGESTLRKLLKYGIADWLPANCSDAELVLACDQALRSGAARSGHARCIAFMSAVGGAGASTLALAAIQALGGRRGDGLQRACAVDLDFQHGALAEYADMQPALRVDEIALRPERLDRHLLEIMVARNERGFAMLAAPPALTTSQEISSEVIGRLLDLAAAAFDHLVLDLPGIWQPWCKDVVRGLDQFFIVTQSTVTGLRQARRQAEMIAACCGIDVCAAVIVNRAKRFGGNVSRTQARTALGPLLAGFVGDASDALTRAQDRGDALTALRATTRLTRDLAAILNDSQQANRLNRSNARSVHA
jgi:pilus assembly protein CpaE